MKHKTLVLIVLLAVAPVLLAQGVEPLWLRIIPKPIQAGMEVFANSSDLYYDPSYRIPTHQPGIFAFLDTMGIIRPGDSLVAIHLDDNQYSSKYQRIKCTTRMIPGENNCSSVDEWVQTVYDGVLYLYLVSDSLNQRNQQFVFQKYSANYKLEWESRVHQPYNGIRTVKQVGNDFAVLSYSPFFGEANSYPQLLKISGVDGSEMWRWIGDTLEDYSYISHLEDFAPTADGGIIAVGRKNRPRIQGEPRWSGQAYTIRLDKNGKEVWNKFYTDSMQKRILQNGELQYLGAELKSIIPMKDGNYLLYGWRNTSPTYLEYTWIKKVDSNLKTIWEKYYAKEKTGQIIKEMQDSRIAIYTGTLLVLDSHGDSLTRFTFPTEPWLEGFKVQGIGSIIVGERDNLYVTCSGYDPTIRNSGNALLKFRLPSARRGRDQQPQDGQSEGVTAVPGKYEIRSIHPNPFNSSTTITYSLPSAGQTQLRLFSTDGREVRDLLSGYQTAGNQTIRLDGSDLPAGVYLLRVEGASEAVTRKIVLIK